MWVLLLQYHWPAQGSVGLATVVAETVAELVAGEGEDVVEPVEPAGAEEEGEGLVVGLACSDMGRLASHTVGI